MLKVPSLVPGFPVPDRRSSVLQRDFSHRIFYFPPVSTLPPPVMDENPHIMSDPMNIKANTGSQRIQEHIVHIKASHPQDQLKVSNIRLHIKPNITVLYHRRLLC